jgi:hypothetical protein
MIIDDILARAGLKYEDLNEVEHEWLERQLEALSQKKITVSLIRDHISKMRESVELELTKVGHETKQDIFLKARLRNYILLEKFLSTPEDAKRQLNQMLAGIPTGKK